MNATTATDTTNDARSEGHPLQHDLRRLISKSPHFVEVRYHNRRARSLGMRKGELSDMSYRHYEGVGLRVLAAGTWGFASTSDLSPAGLERALGAAERMALQLADRKKEKTRLGSNALLARGTFLLPGYNELMDMPLDAKFDLVRKSEQDLAGRSQKIEAGACTYNEIFEEKIILTSDGADVLLRLVRPELRFAAFAADGSRHARGSESVGGTGGWECLFRHKSTEDYIDTAARDAVDLLSAPAGPGGRTQVILTPAMVGLLSHEAIGHTVEADFVKSGSVAAGKLGQKVASELVTLCDSGRSEFHAGAGGELPVDDEGILTKKSVLIDRGRLSGYLHNRESAAEFGVEPAGNARAWEFDDEPLIRMRNTYIEPGDDDLEDMIGGIADGLLVDGPEGGQADATGEFMFGAARVRRIVDGKPGESVQKVTISGNAFDVLGSVDAVSKDFRWDLGSGYCGKGQPARVDAGGPYLRCTVLIGGAQA